MVKINLLRKFIGGILGFLIGIVIVADNAQSYAPDFDCTEEFIHILNAAYIYPVHVTTRKSFGLMTRKLSVTRSRHLRQFLGILSRKKSSVASANCPHVA